MLLKGAKDGLPIPTNLDPKQTILQGSSTPRAEPFRAGSHDSQT